MRPTPLSVRLLPAVLTAVLAVAACSSDGVKPNPTAPNFEGLGSGSPGDVSVNRMGGEDSGTIFGTGKGPKDQNAGA
jgi:hypothetical protein